MPEREQLKTLVPPEFTFDKPTLFACILPCITILSISDQASWSEGQRWGYSMIAMLILMVLSFGIMALITMTSTIPVYTSSILGYSADRIISEGLASEECKPPASRCIENCKDVRTTCSKNFFGFY